MDRVSKAYRYTETQTQTETKTKQTQKSKLETLISVSSEISKAEPVANGVGLGKEEPGRKAGAAQHVAGAHAANRAQGNASENFAPAFATETAGKAGALPSGRHANDKLSLADRPAPQISASPCNSKNDPRTPRQRMKLKRSREAEGRIVIGQLGIRPETVSVLYETGRLPNRFPTRKELYDAVQQHLDSLILGSIDK